MEMTLDVGKNIANEIAVYAQKQEMESDHFALNMLELGLRVHKASVEKEDSEGDETLQLLLKNNTLLEEVVRCVFDKTKVSSHVFDAQTLLNTVKSNTEAYFKGRRDG